MASRTRIKHDWVWGPFGRYNLSKYGVHCTRCGQFVADADKSYLVSFYDQTDCPRFIEIEGNFLIQLSRPGSEIWDDYTHCLNVRQAIEFGRNRWSSFEVRIWDIDAKAWIEI